MLRLDSLRSVLVGDSEVEGTLLELLRDFLCTSCAFHGAALLVCSSEVEDPLVSSSSSLPVPFGVIASVSTRMTTHTLMAASTSKSGVQCSHIGRALTSGEYLKLTLAVTLRPTTRAAVRSSSTSAFPSTSVNRGFWRTVGSSNSEEANSTRSDG